MRLSDAVRASGYDFIIDPQPHLRPDILGNPPNPDTMGALLCGTPGNTYIACRSDSWDWAYACSHEIAEDQHGHVHSAALFSTQANLLARWLRMARPDDQTTVHINPDGTGYWTAIRDAWYRATSGDIPGDIPGRDIAFPQVRATVLLDKPCDTEDA